MPAGEEAEAQTSPMLVNQPSYNAFGGALADADAARTKGRVRGAGS